MKGPFLNNVMHIGNTAHLTMKCLLCLIYYEISAYIPYNTHFTYEMSMHISLNAHTTLHAYTYFIITTNSLLCLHYIILHFIIVYVYTFNNNVQCA